MFQGITFSLAIANTYINVSFMEEAIEIYIKNITQFCKEKRVSEKALCCPESSFQLNQFGIVLICVLEHDCFI